MAELWTRMLDAAGLTKEHPDRALQWDIELSWILAQRMFAGVRVNIALYDENWTPDGTPDTTRLEYIFRRLASNGLKCQLGLGGSGPNIGAWQATLNNNVAWHDITRPSLGTAPGGAANTGILDRVVEIKVACIQKMIEVYESYGLNPYDYCFIELGDEPAVGSPGAPPSTNTTFYSWAGITYSSNLGRWDNFVPAANPKYGASYMEFFTKEVAGLRDAGVFRSLRVVGPTISANYSLLNSSVDSLDLELTTFDADWAATSQNWIDIVRSETDLLFGLRAKYDAFGPGTATISPELFPAPTLSPTRHRRLAIDGFSGLGYVASDPSNQADHECIKWKLGKMRANSTIGKNPILFTNASIHEDLVGMADSTTYMPWGGTFNYYLNYHRLDQMTLAYLDGLRELDVERVIHNAVTDPTNVHGLAAWTDIYGMFVPGIVIDQVPSIGSGLTYSRALAWARRAGLPLTGGVDIGNADKGNYWHKEFIQGASETTP